MNKQEVQKRVTQSGEPLAFTKVNNKINHELL